MVRVIVIAFPVAEFLRKESFRQLNLKLSLLEYVMAFRS